MWLAAVLILYPVVDADMDIRVVGAGVGDASITWFLDGQHVATTVDRAPATIRVTAGEHELRAEADAESWEILARPEPPGPGARYVPAWTAQHEPGMRSQPPADEVRIGAWAWLAAAAAVAATSVVAPRWMERRGPVQEAGVAWSMPRHGTVRDEVAAGSVDGGGVHRGPHGPIDRDGCQLRDAARPAGSGAKHP